jgi:two-component system sporulation sensor kinase A
VDILRFSKTEYWRGLQKGKLTPFRFITIYLSIGLLLITFEQIFFIQGNFFSYVKIVSISLHLFYFIGGIAFFNWCLKKLGRQAHEVSERKSLELLQASEKLVIAGQMAAGIAHEIRNPLTSLKGFLKLMQTGSGGKKEYFNIMDSELDRIELILSELLLLAKPQHEMFFQKKELLNLLQQIIVLLEPQAILNNIQLMTRSLPDQLYINASENHMKQVFINIIKNAIEAMPNGGEIIVEVKQTDGQVRVSITDQGFGIPEEHLTKLGEPFFSTKQTGTGLGLAITHQIVENHGGTIKISSKLGEGTIFDVLLPLAQ